MMDPEEQRLNLAELKRALRGESDENFLWLLENLVEDQGWSCLPPWSDYNLLVLAIELKDYQCVKMLLKKGCRVMKPGITNTPLHSIVRNYNLAWWNLMERFFELGARVSDADGHGDNVVHLINDSPCTLAAYDVLMRQHQKETTVNVKNRDGLSFLHVACSLKNMEVVKKCLDYNKDDVNCQISPTAPFRPGYTPLHFAVEFNNHEAVQLLLRYGADLRIPDAEGSYPVHFALEEAMQHNRGTTILDLLMPYTYVMENVVDNNGLSLLMCACAASSDAYLGEARVFAEENNNTDNKGNAALHYAAKFGRHEIVNRLLESGARCCAANNEGKTPLAMAREQGHENVCNLLEMRCRCGQPIAE